MAPLRLDVLVSDDPEKTNERVLGSPAVGVFRSQRQNGEIVVGGSSIGRLVALGRKIELLVPPGVTGRVADLGHGAFDRAVGFGQRLLRLVPVAAGGEGPEEIVNPADQPGELAEGTFAVRSSIHGMFYQRPRPDEPPYVEIGQIVENGATLGLVEVMKCFSAVVYGGGDLPARAEILEVRADDGAEVGMDQILFVVAPA